MLANTPDLKTDASIVALVPVLERLRSFAQGLVIRTADGYQRAATELKSIKLAIAT